MTLIKGKNSFFMLKTGLIFSFLLNNYVILQLVEGLDMYQIGHIIKKNLQNIFIIAKKF